MIFAAQVALEPDKNIHGTSMGLQSVESKDGAIASLAKVCPAGCRRGCLAHRCPAAGIPVGPEGLELGHVLLKSIT
jgi:hypothetical protein